MHKRIFCASFVMLCCFVFIQTQRYFTDNDIDIFRTTDKEKMLEEAFPYNDWVKEIYGFSNRVISPNEIVLSESTTIKDKDGFLQEIYPVKVDVVDDAKYKIAELNAICHENGTEFSFINYPSKSNSTTISTRYGIETNLEQVRAEFLSYLDEINIDYLNVRELLENDGYTTKDIFYKTDHHWKTTAGFYAARAIANHLNETYDWSLNTAALDEDKFSFTTYDNLWFGETGRNLSRSWVNTLDDFTQIMPNYETSISLYYPNGNETSGDFSIMVDTSGYEGEVDYYQYSAHYSYSKGMGSPMTYHNNLADENGKKILIIKDSFSVVVIPFLTLETSDVTVWDMRDDATKEGLYKYIADNDFDVVLLAYTDFWKANMWNFN